MAARKLRIKDIVLGRIGGDEGTRGLLSTAFGQHDEVRVCGTVMKTFVSDDEGYGNILIDDGSESILAKFWRADVSNVRKFEDGDFIDFIGRAREYNDEKYLHPVQIFKTDVHGWLKFQLEMALGIKVLIDSGKWDAQPKDDYDEISEPSGKVDAEEDLEDAFEEDSIIFDDDDINRSVMDALENESLSKDEIIELTSLDEIDVMLSLKELLESGDIFEVDGKFKRL